MMTTSIASPVRARLLSKVPLAAAAVAVLAVVAATVISVPNLGIFFLQRQDQRLLIVAAIALAICLHGAPRRDAELIGTWRLALVVGGLMAVASLAGHFWLLAGYDLSLDEQRANFDAAILAHGQLVAPLPLEWRDHAGALNTMFMQPGAEHHAWASRYLPIHAALRALMTLIAVPEVTGPLMTLIGALALWGCVRRIWPESREAPVVALLLYAGSGQIWLNGMTAYAMPAHLTLNLCWLWLFLRRSWRADVGALAIGFLAVGLHQLHYHPMFAAPILALLVWERAWRRAAFYFFGYLAIGLFWQWWDHLAMLWTVGAQPPGVAGTTYLTRIAGALAKIDGARIPNMIANLFRLIAWQHLLIVPLVAIGIRAGRRDPLIVALAGGVALTLFVRFTVQPFQGFGLGYRYIHSLIGNLILIAVYGWVSLGEDRAQWRAAIVRTTAASCLILLPIQAWMAHASYAPYAAVSREIDAIGADFVVIGIEDVPYSSDLIRNSPYLDNRPIRLMRERLDPELRSRLCTRHASVVLIGPAMLRPISGYFDQPPRASADTSNRRLAADLQRRGCRVGFA